MLKKLVNHAIIKIKIIPIDPLLIKSGQATVSGTNMAFVQTYRFDGKECPYIPGSSLKGVFRSHAEKICRSLRESPVPVCLPYVEWGKEENGEEEQASCSSRFNKTKKQKKESNENQESLSSSYFYTHSCPTCRLFGSVEFSGRFASSDAYLSPKDDYLLEIRDGVAIDRLTGGAASGAKYDLEVLTRGVFETQFEIRNFERWQLGLTALVLRDLEDEFIRIGFGKSRGLGRIKAEILTFEIVYFNHNPSTLQGIASLCPEEGNRYDFYKEESISSPFLPSPTSKGLRQVYDITSNWKEILEPAVSELQSYIKNSKWPRKNMQIINEAI